MGEENVVTSVTEVTENSEFTGEMSQTSDVTDNAEKLTENTEIFVSETVTSVNVPLEHFDETEIPAGVVINNDDIISSIVAEAVAQSLEEAGVTETAQTEETFVTVTEYISETVSEQVMTEQETTEQITETEAVTQAVTEAITETAVQNSTNRISIDPAFIAVPAVAAVSAAAALIMKKKQKKAVDDDTPMSARDRDAARLEAEKPDKKKGKKSRKNKGEKEKKNLSKKVLSTIPYQKVLSDDIFYLGKKMYSKAYTFDDINFNLADEEQQYMYLERYIEFLGILDDTVDCQICCWNSRLNMEEFKKSTLMP